MEKHQNTAQETIETINIKLDNLIDAITSREFNMLEVNEYTLWDNAKVADYIGVSYKYCNEYIVTHHAFPTPLRVENCLGKKGHPRWYAREVIHWVSDYRET